MAEPNYPARGSNHWDQPLKQYIDGTVDVTLGEVEDEIKDPQSPIGAALSASIASGVQTSVPPAVATALTGDAQIRDEIVGRIGALAADDIGFITDATPGAPTYVESPGNGFIWTDSDGVPVWPGGSDEQTGGPNAQARYFLNEWANEWAESAQVGARSPIMDGRRRFELRLHDIYSSVLNVVVLGASTANGSGANPEAYYGIYALLGKMLQHSYNPVGINGGYGMKVRNGAWTGGGTGEGYEQVDLKQCITLTPGSTPRQFTSNRQPCDGIEIMFTADSAPFTLTIDGGAPITITPDATGIWKSAALTRGVHTFVLHPPTTGATTFSNVYFNDGDRGSGIRLYFGTMPGSRSTEWLPGGTGAGFWSRVEQLQPAIIPMMVGANDANGSSTGPVNPVATYKANLQTLVNEAKARCVRDPWIPLIAQHNTGATYPAYIEAMREVAKANPDVCTFHSYYDSFETTPAAAQADVDDVWVDGETSPAHLSNRGHHMAAQILAAEFQLPSRKTWPTA